MIFVPYSKLGGAVCEGVSEITGWVCGAKCYPMCLAENVFVPNRAIYVEQRRAQIGEGRSVEGSFAEIHVASVPRTQKRTASRVFEGFNLSGVQRYCHGCANIPRDSLACVPKTEFEGKLLVSVLHWSAFQQRVGFSVHGLDAEGIWRDKCPFVSPEEVLRIFGRFNSRGSLLLRSYRKILCSSSLSVELVDGISYALIDPLSTRGKAPSRGEVLLSGVRTDSSRANKFVGLLRVGLRVEEGEIGEEDYRSRSNQFQDAVPTDVLRLGKPFLAFGCFVLSVVCLSTSVWVCLTRPNPESATVKVWGSVDAVFCSFGFSCSSFIQRRPSRRIDRESTQQVQREGEPAFSVCQSLP